MSVSEDSELQDLVKHVLEKSGSMARIRAELRASVFLALEENGCFKNTKNQNESLLNLSKNADGVLLICLIREFLEYFGLSFTASVFDPELASYGVYCSCKDRSKLCNQLNMSQDLSSEFGGPLLCQMLQVIRNVQSRSKLQNQSTEESEEANAVQNCKSSDTSTEYIPYEASSYNYKETDCSSNVDKEIANKSAPKTNHLAHSSKKVSADLRNKIPVSQKNIKDAENSKYNLSSLADLPPLTSPISSPKNPTSPLNKSCKQINKLKAILKDNATDEDASNTSITNDYDNEKADIKTIETLKSPTNAELEKSTTEEEGVSHFF